MQERLFSYDSKDGGYGFPEGAVGKKPDPLSAFRPSEPFGAEYCSTLHAPQCAVLPAYAHAAEAVDYSVPREKRPNLDVGKRPAANLETKPLVGMCKQRTEPHQSS
jgi:hypothetical protein